MEILYEDEDVIVVVKPAGIPTQTANIRQKDLVDEIKAYLKDRDGTDREPYLGIIHRLDQPVSGILVFAKNENAAASLSDQIQKGVFHKYYMAEVEGVPEFHPDEDGIWARLTDSIIKETKQNRAVITDAGYKNAKKAELLYRVVSVDRASDRCLLEISLITGRFHQIRAQMSNMGHPIAGDTKYGAREKTDSIALKAYKLEFIHPKSGKQMSFGLNRV
mgnify:CR=1 FL=1